jgi:hypothetical protein
MPAFTVHTIPRGYERSAKRANETWKTLRQVWKVAESRGHRLDELWPLIVR